MAMGKKKGSDSFELGFLTSLPSLGAAKREPVRNSPPSHPEKVDDETDAVAAHFLLLLDEDISKNSERVTAYTTDEAADDDALLARIKAYKKG